MQLYSNPASPFGRKVKVLAHEAGLISRIEILSETLSPVSPSDAVSGVNPLGKIPCLITDDGAVLYDSRTICEYLDSLQAGARPLFPAPGPARWRALTLQALGDGIMDAAVATRYERALRPQAQQWPAWTEALLLKVSRALDRLEQEAPSFGPGLDIGLIAVGCVLGYLDFRFADKPWREGRPALAKWYETFAARPSMQETRPH